MQTDATLLANNFQHCWMLHVASVCTPCCMLLDVVACCCATFLLFRDRRSVAQQCWIRLHNSSSTLITYGLQRLMGCILPTMRCRSQHCWELLHPFAHHCQHARNNFQHCWRNNVGSCCVCTEPKMRKEFNSHRFFFVPATDSLFCTQIWPPWRHVKTGNQEIFSGQNLYCTRII